MPSKTPKQHRAMAAAAHGQSDLGIPQSVGRDFLKADKGKGTRKKGPTGKTLTRPTLPKRKPRKK